MSPTSPSRKIARARFGLIGAAFGLGFIFGPAISALLSPISHTAPIWAAAALTLVRDSDGVESGFPRPCTAQQDAGTGMPFRNVMAMMGRPSLRPRPGDGFRLLVCLRDLPDHIRAVRRGALTASTRRGTAAFFAAFAVLGALVQGIFIRTIVRRFGDKTTLMLGLVCAAIGLVAATLTHTVTLFAVSLVPLALGIGFGHPTMSSLISRAAGAEEQGRVSGRPRAAVESLGRDDWTGVGERVPCSASASRRPTFPQPCFSS
jgi:DHA1 family tetracycline resistance protein-like MFS transporter